MLLSNIFSYFLGNRKYKLVSFFNLHAKIFFMKTSLKLWGQRIFLYVFFILFSASLFLARAVVGHMRLLFYFVLSNISLNFIKSSIKITANILFNFIRYFYSSHKLFWFISLNILIRLIKEYFFQLENKFSDRNNKLDNNIFTFLKNDRALIYFLVCSTKQKWSKY